MIVVDASVWISLWVPQDEHHQASRAWLKAKVDAGVPLIEPSLLVVEIAAGIARRTRKPAFAMRAVQQLQSIPQVRLVALDAAAALAASEFAATHRLRGADAIYASLAHTFSIPLVTWDGEQIARTQGVVTAHQPVA